jgi:hypothetical protein
MSDDRHRTTRRGALALAGAAALAGCGGLPGPLGSSQPSLDGARLAAAVDGDVPEVPRTLPVDVSDEHVRRHVERANALLSRAPLPFDRTQIPNGAMREEMNEVATSARAKLERARDAASPLTALFALRDARGRARAVATAWAYADDGLRGADLADDADALAADVASFRDRRSYVGADPVRALLVHATVDSLVRSAAHNADGRRDGSRLARAPETLVSVSEEAAALERGRAALADAAHLYDRLRDGPARSRDLADAFDAALAELLDALRSGAADLDGSDPVSAHVDADVEDAPVSYPLEYLAHDVDDVASVTVHRDRGQRAAALRSAHRELTRLRAFEALRERVEDGETYAVETVEDVAAVRSGAVGTVERALRETNHPHLSRAVLHGLTELVASADDELAAYGDRDRVTVDWIRRDVGDYVYAAAVAGVTPAASDEVAAAVSVEE